MKYRVIVKITKNEVHRLISIVGFSTYTSGDKFIMNAE